MLDAYPEYERLLASAQLALAMLGMGALLGPRDFVLVLLQPRALLLGLGLQLALVPALAAGLGSALPVPAGIAAGLVLVACVPGGTISNVFTYFARGHIALSISLTAVTTVAALVTTPALLRLWLGTSVPDFEMPVARVAREIATTLLLPLGAGMLFGASAPQHREVFSRWSIRASLFVIVLIAIGAGGSGRLDPRSFGFWGLGAQWTLCFAAMLAATLACHAAKLASPERAALVIEVTVRNTNLALLVKALLFPAVAGQTDPIGDGMLFVTILYGGFQLLIAVPLVLWSRRRIPKPAASG